MAGKIGVGTVRVCAYFARVQTRAEPQASRRTMVKAQRKGERHSVECGHAHQWIVSEEEPRHQMPLPHPELVLRGKPIKVSLSYKYLGIHVDNQLRWTTQSRRAIAKATAWILLFRRLTRPASGFSAKHMRQLYLAVAVPKMTYGIDT